jgi:hypothetical protein
MVQKSMGTTNMVRSSTIIPPKMGTAIGPMMSAPRPVEVSPYVL